MTDYTQTGEQKWLDNLPDSGRFLDIGAYDGLTFSNTRALAERGWTGVWVEPAAHAFTALVKNALPGVSLVNALVGENTEIKRFHYSVDAVSTTEDAHARRWGKVVEFTETYVMQLSVEDLLFAFPCPYDLISIDTEGTSLEILELLEGHLDGTRMVIVEHDGSNPECRGFKEVGRTDNNVILEAL